ncbi:RipA family octameric membrane protein [Mycobacterium syngnathidarum]
MTRECWRSTSSAWRWPIACPRRALANAFFLTVNTTLIAVVGLSTTKPDSTLRFIAVCVAGVAVSACWLLLLRVYRRLNAAKFAVINQIEADYLPVKPFTDEWAELMPDGAAEAKLRDRLGKMFRELGNVERFVPIVFGLLYIVLVIGRLCL